MIVHGQIYTGAWKSWAHMKDRCDNSRADNHFGKGITYDPAWAEFAAFYADMGDRPAGMSLDRIDNTANYCKANCRWATAAQQMNNTSRCIFVEHTGKRQTLTQWAREFGLHPATVLQRYKKYGNKPAIIFRLKKGKMIR
jgi:hypothetical protein